MSRYEGMIAETVSYSGFGGDLVEAYLARPLGPGPYPAVILVHHMPGWDDNTKAIARRFAYAGYVGICPNLYCREAPNASSDDAAATVRASGGTSDVQFVGDAGGAAVFLRSLPYTNGKVGSIGWCSGGRQSLLAGCRLNLDAVVDCYGGRVIASAEDLTPARPVAVVDLVEGLSAPLLGLFGVEDKNPSPAHVEALHVALENAGKAHEFHTYDDAGHGFMSADRPSYRVEATNDAWAKIITFYEQHLAAS